MRKNMFTAGLLIVIILIACFYYNRYRIAPKMDFNSLELTDLDNAPVKMEAFKGKKLFVNFFATWCGPCVREIPAIDNAQVLLQNKNFVFVCISDEPVERLKFFRDRMQMNVLLLHSAKKFKDINIFTFPTNYLINDNGEIVFRKTGELNLHGGGVAEELMKMTE